MNSLRKGEAKSENRKIKLLIVDDDEKFLKTISERLGLKDFEVTSTTKGETAIKSAKKEKFDVAILDLKMPGMDGTELLKILKKKHKFLEVIMLTGFASIDSAVECTKLGAFGYLEKPYSFEKLLETLKAAYETRLRKKFEHDKKRMDEIEILSMGSSPMGILRSLIRIDDDEK
jgi:DNA-binding NtrC family response regulator